MSAQVTVLYPAKPSATFDMSYYLSTHMPLVQESWGPVGLKSWTVLQFGPDQPYSVQATLVWESMQKFQAAAAGDKTERIMGDIKNFSSEQPVLIPGEVVGSK